MNLVLTSSPSHLISLVTSLGFISCILQALIGLMVISSAEGYRFRDSSHNSIHLGSSHHKAHHSHHHRGAHSHKSSRLLKTFYPTGHSEGSLPTCSPNSVCNKLDTYGTPWVEKQCHCPGKTECSTSTHVRDGHTIVDRTRQYKVCEPVKKLKRCKYFRDITWTYISNPDNSTTQLMHCRCPKNSVAYLIKRRAYATASGMGFQYSFACSPQTTLRCQRKEPCRLFSVRQNAFRPSVDEVNMSTLCQCPRKRKCPSHHLDSGVVPGKAYSEDSIRTYSGYCV